MVDQNKQAGRNMSANTITLNAKSNTARDKPIIDGLISLGQLPEFQDLSLTGLARRLLREGINRHRPGGKPAIAS